MFVLVSEALPGRSAHEGEERFVDDWRIQPR
jgi:hypothetical protein